MKKSVMALAALLSLNALAWSSSTAWQWNETGRAGKYDAVQMADASNAAAFGPRVCLARAGAASGVETLEARLFGTVSLTGQVLEKYGFMLMFR